MIHCPQFYWTIRRAFILLWGDEGRRFLCCHLPDSISTLLHDKWTGMKDACHVVWWFCQSKSVCKADWYLEPLLAGKVPGGPDRKRVLSDQAFHIGRLFPGMQPQKWPPIVSKKAGKSSRMGQRAILLQGQGTRDSHSIMTSMHCSMPVYCAWRILSVTNRIWMTRKRQSRMNKRDSVWENMTGTAWQGLRDITQWQIFDDIDYEPGL